MQYLNMILQNICELLLVDGLWYRKSVNTKNVGNTGKCFRGNIGNAIIGSQISQNLI